MFEEKLGAFPKTLVIFDGQTIKLSKNIKIDKDDIVETFVTEPKLGENGSVYFSKTGNPAKSTINIAQRGFFYTKKQKPLVMQLLDLLDVEANEGDYFTNISKSSAEKKNVKVKKNARVCPKCESPDIQFMENKKKGFSVGKAVAGGVLTGGIGTVAGFAGKKGKKDRWHCTNCGNVFELKSK